MVVKQPHKQVHAHSMYVQCQSGMGIGHTCMCMQYSLPLAGDFGGTSCLSGDCLILAGYLSASLLARLRTWCAQLGQQIFQACESWLTQVDQI